MAAAPKEELEVEVPIDGGETRTVTISNPSKPFFKATGQTKLDLVQHYLAVGPQLLAATQGRATMLQRHPDGASGKSFFQKRVPEHAPEWLRTTEMSTPNGTTSNALVVADLAHVVWAVNLGCIGLHPWPVLAAEPGRTDELRIDLDPGPGVTFEMVREGALETRAVLADHGIAGYVKTTGSRGLHVYVRAGGELDSYDVRRCAVALARELERRRPDLLTAAWWKEERGERLFIDYNQNAPHKTVFGAWCARPRVGAQVSTPIAWDEVPTVEPDELTIDAVARRHADGSDPWAAMHDDPQDLGPLLERAAADDAVGLGDAPWPPVYPKMPGEPSRVAPSRARAPDGS